MPINPNLLIAAPMLQDVLIDNVTGLPMVNGVVTMFQDNSRTTLKNWYYQSGSPGAYTYITLPNPLTLSGIGTIQDPNGNDTIPFFYPYSEVDNVTPQPYFVTVVDSNGQAQFTRQNFPFNPLPTSTGTQIPTLGNLITNGQFWRNQPTNGGNFTSLTQAVLAPDQHDGFSMPDIQFFKSTTGATDTATFLTFANTQFLNPLNTNPINQDVTPEFYLEMACTATTPGETFKYVQIPVQLHINNLKSTSCTFTLWARANSGASSITISTFMFTGTGATAASQTGLVQTIALTSNWTKYTVPFTFPSIPTLATLGTGGDDAWYIQIGFPLSALFNIDIAKPSLYIGNVVPTNDFKTYDSINYVISSARTGDVRTSFNYFNSSIAVPNYPTPGWIPLNDGTIGNVSSGATTFANNSSWQLYNLLWNSTLNAFCPLITSGGTFPARGASAYADFIAGNQLFLPKALGRVLAGADPSGTSWSKPFTVNGGGSPNVNVDDQRPYYTGQPITVANVGGSLPFPLLPATTYYVIYVNVGLIYLAATILDAVNNNPIPFSGSVGSGTNTIIATINAHGFGSYTGIDSQTNLSISLVGGSAIVAALNGQSPGGVTNGFNNNQPTTYGSYLIKL